MALAAFRTSANQARRVRLGSISRIGCRANRRAVYQSQPDPPEKPAGRGRGDNRDDRGTDAPGGPTPPSAASARRMVQKGHVTHGHAP